MVVVVVVMLMVVVGGVGDEFSRGRKADGNICQDHS